MFWLHNLLEKLMFWAFFCSGTILGAKIQTNKNLRILGAKIQLSKILQCSLFISNSDIIFSAKIQTGWQLLSWNSKFKNMKCIYAIMLIVLIIDFLVLAKKSEWVTFLWCMTHLWYGNIGRKTAAFTHAYIVVK